MKNQVFSFYESLGEDAVHAMAVFNLYFPSGYDFFELDQETKERFIAENPRINRALLHALNAGRKMAGDVRQSLISARHSESFGRFAQSELGSSNQEQVCLALLNTQLDLIGWEVVFVGTLTEVSASPREIFQRALKANAYAMIIAHNHPSGHLQPSEEDLLFTKRLRQLGQLMALPLLDAFIVTRTSYWSFVEEGRFEDEKGPFL
ncbi:JAB domain-containing protein [Fructobacillus fructosus]|uniref:Contains a helix-hairpin-helix DNA-binding motif (RadC) n=3 Tax=Fructobacillus fructosus TaxID=1631 RepID=A0ABM9MTA8_9LACO|nr:JAB domain-containing protein [Fructobacillus fructosus]MBD9365774.1 JAB domain-containing protein [Leuconostoc mesenteroides]MBC9118998.1 JAB domain-containing protein [Fructobacillus fructosus]MCK8638575.1 JAB domain-containing protein [Fructobacillus fructosus]CAK1238477.1 DNA repair protein RadC [Fructobacillus fructosus]CAK1238651.1 DNA repair protein RadC [Fructobacillus fructosus]